MSFKNGPLHVAIDSWKIFSYSGEDDEGGRARVSRDSAVLGQAPISTTALQKLHKSLAKSAENLREILEREGERERWEV